MTKAKRMKAIIEEMEAAIESKRVELDKSEERLRAGTNGLARMDVAGARAWKGRRNV